VRPTSGPPDRTAASSPPRRGAVALALIAAATVLSQVLIVTR